jgi:hypothetical protein
MAKIIDYPRVSLKSAMQLAEAIDGFAGSCSAELAAEKLGKKISGAFSAQIASASKFRLVDNKAGKLSVTSLYRNYKLAYTSEDANICLRDALLSPPLFRAVYERFKGQKLPIEHFQKMLIKEFEVPDDLASRVAGYFLEGAKQSGLLNGDNTLMADLRAEPIDEELEEEKVLSPVTAQQSGAVAGTTNTDDSAHKSMTFAASDDYHLSIRGPGTSFAIEIRDQDDLEIVQIMLKKIERAIAAKDLI